MPTPIILTKNTLSGSGLGLRLRSDFEDSFRQQFDGIESALGGIMRLGIPSTLRSETYAARRTMPDPERWDRGDPIPEEGTDAVQWSVTNYRYAKRISWERDDRMDNQVGDLVSDARTAGARFAMLPSRIAVEMLENSPSLLETIPNAPDGNALFLAGSRFGHASGNVSDTTAVSATAPTAAEFESSFFNMLARFNAFQDEKGQPFFDPGMGAASYVLYIPSHLRATAIEALRANLVHSVVSSTGASKSNVILASGETFTIHFSARLSSSVATWYGFREDAPEPPLFQQLREGQRFAMATEDNSDVARDTGTEYVQFVERHGYGVNIPYGAIKNTFST